MTDQFLCSTTNEFELMMKLLVALVLLSILFNGSVSRTITVDEDKGYDNVSCVGNPALAFCKTLSYAVSQIVEKANVTIKLQSEFITLRTVIHFDQWTNVTLKGQGKDISSIKCNYTTTHNESMGLVFNNSNGIQYPLLIALSKFLQITIKSLVVDLLSKILPMLLYTISVSQIMMDLVQC